MLSKNDQHEVQQFKQTTHEKLKHVRCPEHHRPPRLRFFGSSLRDIGVSISGCCATLMQLANAQIASAATDATLSLPAAADTPAQLRRY